MCGECSGNIEEERAFEDCSEEAALDSSSLGALKSPASPLDLPLASFCTQGLQRSGRNCVSFMER
jgi:hypothetical protein